MSINLKERITQLGYELEGSLIYLIARSDKLLKYLGEHLSAIDFVSILPKEKLDDLGFEVVKFENNGESYQLFLHKDFVDINLKNNENLSSIFPNKQALIDLIENYMVTMHEVRARSVKAAEFAGFNIAESEKHIRLKAGKRFLCVPSPFDSYSLYGYFPELKKLLYSSPHYKIDSSGIIFASSKYRSLNSFVINNKGTIEYDQLDYDGKTRRGHDFFSYANLMYASKGYNSVKEQFRNSAFHEGLHAGFDREIKHGLGCPRNDNISEFNKRYDYLGIITDSIVISLEPSRVKLVKLSTEEACNQIKDLIDFFGKSRDKKLSCEKIAYQLGPIIMFDIARQVFGKDDFTIEDITQAHLNKYAKILRDILEEFLLYDKRIFDSDPNSDLATRQARFLLYVNTRSSN